MTAAAESDLLTITIQRKTGQIVKVEGGDKSSAHHALAQENRTDFGEETLEALIKQAFEAGIACVLGDAMEQGEEEAEEPEEERDLRHLLLEDLIEHSPVQRLMRREILSRAFVETAIQDAIDNGAPDPESSRAHQRPQRSAGKPRQRGHASGKHHSSANRPH